jgi:hypothetical protein
VCWAQRSRNEYWTVTADALAAHLGWPAPRSDTKGPFALAEPAHLRAMLGRAGWRDVQISELTEPLCIGSDVDDAVAFELADPELASDLSSADPASAAAAVADLRAAFAARARRDGVWLAAAA